MYLKIDLNNFFHFAKLRMDAHAQKEIQDYASAMYELQKNQSFLFVVKPLKTIFLTQKHFPQKR